MLFFLVIPWFVYYYTLFNGVDFTIVYTNTLNVLLLLYKPFYTYFDDICKDTFKNTPVFKNCLNPFMVPRMESGIW